MKKELRCRYCNMEKKEGEKPKDGECPVKLRHKFVGKLNTPEMAQ